MNKKEYKLSIGTRRPTKIMAWDLLDAKVRYLKKIGLWDRNYSDQDNQKLIDQIKVS